MTRKDYQILADSMGETFFLASKRDGERGRTFVYDTVYTPLVQRLSKNNDGNFDLLRFSHACAVAEGACHGFKNGPAYDRSARPDWIYGERDSEPVFGATQDHAIEQRVNNAPYRP